MDLGIAGRKAIVCGASAGLGLGVAKALAADAVTLTLVARGEERLRAAAQGIARGARADVTCVAADVTTDEGRDKVLGACPSPDILINNAGGPPAGDFRTFTREDWMKALEGNMLSAIFLIQATIDGMIARKFGRVINITSYMVKSPGPSMGMSNGARAGLTGFIGGNVNYQGATNSQLGDLPLLAVKAYTLVDLRAGVESAGGAWKATVWVRNLGDTYYWTSANRDLDTTARFTGMPRTFGVTLSYRYS